MHKERRVFAAFYERAADGAINPVIPFKTHRELAFFRLLVGWNVGQMNEAANAVAIERGFAAYSVHLRTRPGSLMQITPITLTTPINGDSNA